MLKLIISNSRSLNNKHQILYNCLLNAKQRVHLMKNCCSVNISPLCKRTLGCKLYRNPLQLCTCADCDNFRNSNRLHFAAQNHRVVNKFPVASFCKTFLFYRNLLCVSFCNYLYRNSELFEESLWRSYSTFKGKTAVISNQEDEIILIDSYDKILGIRKKKDAEVFALKQNLKLMRTEHKNLGNKYPIYKMVSSAQLHEERKKNLEERKDAAQKVKEIKKLSLSCKIEKNDLDVKLKTVRKWIKKDCEVHIVVTGSGNISKMETVYQYFVDGLKDIARFVQKNMKDDLMKFIILPPKIMPLSPKPQSEESQPTSEDKL